MKKSARHVQDIPGRQNNVEQRFVVGLDGVLLCGPRQLDNRLVNDPMFPACHLQHEDIVGVKVHAQTSSTRRSDVRVGLGGVSQRQLEVLTRSLVYRWFARAGVPDHDKRGQRRGSDGRR